MTEITYQPFKGREIDRSKPVRVYRNLNNGKISIKQGALVVGHTDEAFLQNCRFLVSEPLRQKVLLEKRKSVHAYIEGMWSESVAVPKRHTAIWYNPYLTAHFRTVEINEICQMAPFVRVDAKGHIMMWNK